MQGAAMFVAALFLWRWVNLARQAGNRVSQRTTSYPGIRLTVSAASSARLAATEEEELLPFVVEVYPNPTVTNTLKVRVHGAAYKQVVLQIVDVNGRLVVKQELDVQSQQHTAEVDLTHAPAGLLLLRVSTPEQSQVKKLLKQ